MSHPDEDVLADLALGVPDAERDSATSGALAHLETCETCANTVTDLRRTLAILHNTEQETGWSSPGPDVWSRIIHDLDASESARAQSQTPGTAPTETGAGQADPPEKPIELRRKRRAHTTGRRRRNVGWAAGMAAAGLVVGLLGGHVLWHDSTPGPTTVTQVSLDTLDTSKPQKLGEAAVVRTSSGYELDVRTAKPLKSDSGYLEVWLINRDGKRMVSVGVLRGDGPAFFPISQTLIDQGYTIVDISREQFDDNPAHSGDSIVRGQLPA